MTIWNVSCNIWEEITHRAKHESLEYISFVHVQEERCFDALSRESAIPASQMRLGEDGKERVGDPGGRR